MSRVTAALLDSRITSETNLREVASAMEESDSFAAPPFLMSPILSVRSGITRPATVEVKEDAVFAMKEIESKRIFNTWTEK